MVRGFNRSRGPITVLLAALLLVGVLPVRSNAQRTNVQKTNAQRPNAQRQFAFRTLPVSPPRNTIPLASSCPNQGGILDSISVPVSYPLELAVVSFVPAPKGGATFKLSSEDPSIVAAGDPKQSFLPEVTIPEGQTQSNPFFVFGIKVGATNLDAISETPGFFGFSDPLGAWDINPSGDPSTSKFVDANPPSATCRASATSTSMSTDPSVLSTCGTAAQGAAADGLTQVLLRMVSGLGGTACFDITSSGPPDQGTITTDVTGTQSVGSFNDAFSFYQAPSPFDDIGSDSRQVKVQFTFTPNIGNGNTTKFTVPLKLIRPPLLLIHGLWADRKTWPSMWMRSPASSYITYTADYGPTHDASFTTNEKDGSGLRDFNPPAGPRRRLCRNPGRCRGSQHGRDSHPVVRARFELHASG